MGYPDVVFNFLEGENGYVHQKGKREKSQVAAREILIIFMEKKHSELHNKNE